VKRHWIAFLVLAEAAGPALCSSCASSPAANSDPHARAIAQDVLERMGGEEALERARFVCWRFFGRRFHVWDRSSGAARLEQGTSVVFHNVNHPGSAGVLGGHVFQDGEEVRDPKLREAAFERAYAAFANDSFWLFMPAMLLDPDVRLAYRGTAELEPGRSADVLRATFLGARPAPHGMVDLYVAQDTGLVERWDCYADPNAQEPAVSAPWLDWKQYGPILLSGDRGELGSLTDIGVFEQLPSSVFSDPGAPSPLTESAP
jgi:hypothetical protein